MKQILPVLLLFFFTISSPAQTLQNLKGRVLDTDSKTPLVGVVIALKGETVKNAISDEQGYFKIEGLTIGKYAITATYVGYEDLSLDNIAVYSGKETYVPLEMVEKSAEIGSVVVSGTKRIGSYNDMATLSSRTFNAEEAERYPASRQDPARMVSNYAGVQGTDDSRNDIVVRGNSPLGLLWRFEGIDIPNPSHYAIAGSSGGPISILNNKTISHSDFMTGAFSGEYGNALSGVFDIRMRNGNRDRHEHTAQIGVFGLELMSEGPINKKKGSTYLAAYRYSTFAAFEAIDFKLGTDAVPQYQDASFKLHFPMKNKASLDVWGVGGLSNIDIVFSDDTVPTNDLYGLNDRDQYFTTNTFTVGVTHKKFFENEWASKLTIAQSAQQINSIHEFLVWDSVAALSDNLILDSIYPVQAYKMYEGKTAIHWSMNKKFNARNRLKFGVIGDLFQVRYEDSSTNEYVENWVTRLDANDQYAMARAYVSHKYRINSRLVMNSGLHTLYFSKNNEVAVEPRLGFKYTINEKSSASVAYGLHSRTQPNYIYYTLMSDSAVNPTNPTIDTHNEDLGLSKSHHFVGAYDLVLSKMFRMKIEAYYQRLFNIPVEASGGSFSLINQGSGFVRFFPGVLENTGTGTNYGTELTLEKFFSKNFFFLTSASLFDSKYEGKDGVTRNTDFNGNYIVNILGGYEKEVGPNGKNVLQFGTKLTYGGGRRHSPVDSAKTIEDGINVHFIDSERNSLQFPAYFRWDVKFGYVINGKKASHEIALDLVNVTNHENLLTVVYANNPDKPGTKRLIEQPQLAFLPILYYKVNF